MTEEIRLLMFDLDGTLCQYATPRADCLSVAFETLDIDPFFTAADLMDRMDDLDGETANASECRRVAAASLAAERGYDQSVGTEVGKTYSHCRRHSEVEALAGIDEIASLADQYTLALVTNANKDVQQPKLESLGITALFETVVYAGRDSAQKPHPEPFQTALQTVGVAPNETLHVGDGFESDILGAHNLGITTVWITDNQLADSENSPTFQIPSVEKLPPLLQRISSTITKR